MRYSGQLKEALPEHVLEQTAAERGVAADATRQPQPGRTKNKRRKEREGQGGEGAAAAAGGAGGKEGSQGKAAAGGGDGAAARLGAVSAFRAACGLADCETVDIGANLAKLRPAQAAGSSLTAAPLVVTAANDSESRRHPL